MGEIRAAMGDGFLTLRWVFCVSTVGIFTSLISSALGVQGLPLAAIFIINILIFVLVFVFSAIRDVMGGVSFNPTATAAFFAAGAAPDFLISMAFRFPAQTASAVGGALAIMEVMPTKYKRMLGGPSLKVN